MHSNLELPHQWRDEKSDGSSLEAMIKEVKSYDANKILRVTRAFSHFLGIQSIHSYLIPS
jgi:hypothetical protein